MKNFLRLQLCLVGLAALLSTSSAQIIEFRAVINAAQETPVNSSPATGTAVLFYDLATNTFNLSITLNGFANTLTNSHIHEGLPGVAGGVVTGLGAEAAYTRSGSTLTATFRGLTHGGDRLKLLQNGAYLNFHTAAYPGGEVRGQLIAQPKRLTALIDVAQEQAALPATTINSRAFGAALISYNPGTSKITFSICVYAFTNTFSNSHFHEGAPGVSGPVVHGIGAASVYNVAGGVISKTFSDQTYGGDPIRLLTGGTYLNFHSNVYAGGEIRGQVLSSDETPSSRLANASTRGLAGAGDQALITGFVVQGPEPVGVVIGARGPSLTRFGVAGAVADPALTIYDSRGLLVASNDNQALGFTTSAPPFYDAKDAALRLILPPGVYTVVINGVGGVPGVALGEITEDRNPSL
ncbi:MAG: CHRD domain-containing protein [Opitutae bacterium]|nr:CHRD domain-containing protein [Opitutae bacterium]